MDPQLYSLIAAIKSDSGIGVRTALAANPGLLSAACDELGRTPLHFAAQLNRASITDVLIKAGADFYAQDANGQLPLDVPPGETLNAARQHLRQVNAYRNEFLFAVHQQQIDVVRAKLEHDASLVSVRDVGDGASALMIACFHGNAELVRLLLHAGVRLDLADFSNGFDATYVCAEKGNGDCMRALLQAGIDPHRTWRVQYGPVPMQMNALHVASWKGKADVVAALLEHGADPNVRTKSYAVFAPLHFAASDGHTAVVQALLAHGADHTSRDGRRAITALEMAELGNHAETAAVLRSPPVLQQTFEKSPYNAPIG